MLNFNSYGYNTLLVNKIEEAQNAPIDFTGNPVLYLNKVKNEIYLKQFDMASGKTFFGRYIFDVQPVEEPKKDDELKIINDKLDYLYEKFEKMSCQIDTNNNKKKAVKDDE